MTFSLLFFLFLCYNPRGRAAKFLRWHPPPLLPPPLSALGPRHFSSCLLMIDSRRARLSLRCSHQRSELASLASPIVHRLPLSLDALALGRWVFRRRCGSSLGSTPAFAVSPRNFDVLGGIAFCPAARGSNSDSRACLQTAKKNHSTVSVGRQAPRHRSSSCRSASGSALRPHSASPVVLFSFDE